MYIYVGVYRSIAFRVSTDDIYLHKYAHIYIFTYIHIYIHIYDQVNSLPGEHWWHVYPSICIHIYIYIHTYIYIYMCVGQQPSGWALMIQQKTASSLPWPHPTIIWRESSKFRQRLWWVMSRTLMSRVTLILYYLARKCVYMC